MADIDFLINHCFVDGVWNLDEVVVDEPLADGFFLVGAGIARAAGGGPGGEDDCGAAVVTEAGVHVLDPPPVGGGFAGEAL